MVEGSVQHAVEYIESLKLNEPKFVLVVMVVVATRPVVLLAEQVLAFLARQLPRPESVGFCIVALTVGPLLGSFITEPASMSLLATLLKRR